MWTSVSAQTVSYVLTRQESLDRSDCAQRQIPIRSVFIFNTGQDVRPPAPRGVFDVSDLNGAVQENIEAIRDVLADQGRLTGDARSLPAEADLYGAGLTSLATVGVMLALEDRFDVEFPETLLSRETFRNIAAIEEAIRSLRD